MAETRVTPSNPSNAITSSIDPGSQRYQKNARAMADLVGSFARDQDKLREGGGAKAIDSQHAKGRLTARERMRIHLEPGTELLELGIYAAYQMYEEWGGAPGAGTVTGLGRVHGRLFMLIVNDATVKAGRSSHDGQEGDPGAEHRH
jgi:Acetyl-CoA carboxylase, carboxyltransferase component (subunits alpha and beta)